MSKIDGQTAAKHIRDRAAAARVSVNEVLGRAGVSKNMVSRWSGGMNALPHTFGKVTDALDAIEAERIRGGNQ